MEIKKNKLVITEKEGIICYGYFEDGIPTELYCEPKEQQSILGNIYAARVERVAEGIHGAFLEIGERQKCYYPLSSDQPIKLSPGHEEKLYGGDIILIQITKDAVKTKLPVGTGNISLNGKYFVFTLTDKRTGISKKIRKNDERERLDSIVKKYRNEKYGIVVRTNAAGVSEEILIHELESLQVRYEELMRKAKIAAGKTLLYREPAHYITLAKELPEKSLDEILTDNVEIFAELNEYYRVAIASDTIKISFYEDNYSLYNLYRFSHFYEEAYVKYVWLKSGASLVIEPTEAMTVIDVNTGSVLKKKRQEDTLFYQINREAAKEIARQLRLRNISGIIMIDFINMKDTVQKEKLLTLLDSECKKDRVYCNVVDMTALNLVEMTRSKVRRPLHEQIDSCRKRKTPDELKN